MVSARMIAMALPLILVTAPVTAGTFKCWTNKEGVRECGNTIPPEYAQQSIQVVNEQGITVDKRERAKTPEELAAEQAAKQAAEEKAAEEARVKAEQDRRDAVLLAVYTSAEDIIKSRDKKVESLDSLIQVTQAGLETVENKLAEERKNAATLERVGRPVSDKDRAIIADLERQQHNKQFFIQQKEEEKQRIIDTHNADLARYKELRGLQ